ncbi:MAG: DUF1924 domain-containing protein [Alphaproteobacteria bacterium]|nr:MAG: DUF1924 domain-containing protein [Alphaproteobacteria bacterium]
MTRSTLILVGALAALASAAVAADRRAIISAYGDPAGFSAARGKAFFEARHTGGKPETPSCTTCHTANPRAEGRTRAGKPIAPMAVSANPERFTDPAKVEKWFRRNCNSVLGRECTAKEKGDVLTYLSSL